ncbi:MAG: hypothetical protein P8Y04_13580 [Desulfobulbaceae bacterium]
MSDISGKLSEASRQVKNPQAIRVRYFILILGGPVADCETFLEGINFVCKVFLQYAERANTFIYAETIIHLRILFWRYRQYIGMAGVVETTDAFAGSRILTDAV